MTFAYQLKFVAIIEITASSSTLVIVYIITFNSFIPEENAV